MGCFSWICSDTGRPLLAGKKAYFHVVLIKDYRYNSSNNTISKRSAETYETLQISVSEAQYIAGKNVLTDN